MSRYKLIQLTNQNIGAIAADTYIPLGLITRKLNVNACECPVFQITSSTSDTLYLNEPGYYKVTYTGSFSAAAVGEFNISLIANGVTVFTETETVAAAEDVVNLSTVFILRVCPNTCATPGNCPVALQVKLGDIATVGTSVANLIVERVY